MYGTETEFLDAKIRTDGFSPLALLPSPPRLIFLLFEMHLDAGEARGPEVVEPGDERQDG